jgi:hypothetical protein
MRREEEYRRRLHQVNTTVKRRLDYQVEVEHAQQKFEQQHMVQWLEKAVTELVKGKQVKKGLTQLRVTEQCRG